MSRYWLPAPTLGDVKRCASVVEDRMRILADAGAGPVTAGDRAFAETLSSDLYAVAKNHGMQFSEFVAIAHACCEATLARRRRLTYDGGAR